MAESEMDTPAGPAAAAETAAQAAVPSLANDYEDMIVAVAAGGAVAATGILGKLRQDGWETGAIFSSPLNAPDLDELWRCLVIAESLAAQFCVPRLVYRWRPDAAGGGRHAFSLAAAPPHIIEFARSFVTTDLVPTQIKIYVETLVRDLRAAAREGCTLLVRAGSVQRLVQQPEAGASEAAGAAKDAPPAAP